MLPGRYSAYNSETLALGLNGYNESSLDAAVCKNCTDGASPPQGSPGCPFQRGRPANMSHEMIQMMAISESPHGPWRQVAIDGLTTGWDWNTALTILPDGSAVALIRGGMTWHASNYSDNTTWHAVGAPPGEPEGPQWPTGVEDPYATHDHALDPPELLVCGAALSRQAAACRYIWVDADGIFHAIAHAFTPFYGVHAYVHPKDVPKDWKKDVMRWTLGGVAYGNSVNFTDGTSYAFSRRERPHLVPALCHKDCFSFEQ